MSATAKQQGPEGRTGPAGHGPQCLTLLSEPTRKLAVWLKTAPPPQLCKQQGPEGRTGPAGHGPHCLINVAFWTYKKTSCLTCLPPAKGSKRRRRHSQTAGPWGTDRACRSRPPLPNVAFWSFWTYKKTSCLTCLPAAKPHKRRLRHTKTAGPWGTDRACGPRPLSSNRQASQTAPSPHQSSRALRDGLACGPRPLSSNRQASHTAPSPHENRSSS